MVTYIYSIYDAKAKIYNRPFHLINDAVANRTAIDLVSDKSTDVAKHPEDFIMFRLGTFDDVSCVYNLDADPVVLFRFHEIQLSL